MRSLTTNCEDYTRVVQQTWCTTHTSHITCSYAVSRDSCLSRTPSHTNNDFPSFLLWLFWGTGARKELCIPPGLQENILKVNSGIDAFLFRCRVVPSTYPPEHTISIRFFQSNLAWWPRDTAYQPHSSRFLLRTKIVMYDGTVRISCKIWYHTSPAYVISHRPRLARLSASHDNVWSSLVIEPNEKDTKTENIIIYTDWKKVLKKIK